MRSCEKRSLTKHYGEGEKYQCNFYSGGHKFDRAMQADAFAWFDTHLGNGKQK